MQTTVILERGESLTAILDGHALTLAATADGDIELRATDCDLSQFHRDAKASRFQFVPEAGAMSTSDGLGA